MKKLFALALVAALAACSSMSGNRDASSGNPAETKNSTDSNRSGNPAAVSPGAGSGGASSGSSSGGSSR